MKTGKKSTNVRKTTVEHQERGMFLYPPISSCPHWLHFNFDTYIHTVCFCVIFWCTYEMHTCVDILQSIIRYCRCRNEIMAKLVVYIWIIILIWFIQTIPMSVKVRLNVNVCLAHKISDCTLRVFSCTLPVYDLLTSRFVYLHHRSASLSSEEETAKKKGSRSHSSSEEDKQRKKKKVKSLKKKTKKNKKEQGKNHKKKQKRKHESPSSSSSTSSESSDSDWDDAVL